ncbi:MAG: FHA domain-containing protein [Pyrinomonadaceae bacterium]|nr:FHA domain-containing protein [Pyrinomonadaceae bacterium]
MSETRISPRKKPLADWLFRGVLTKLGDTFDRLTGRRWTPSSSLATSELIERIKKLLDAEARDIPGKGKVVPHLIKLKIQWDKFSTESETLIGSLQDELLTATIDHINDSLYYTYAPVELEVKVDYFVDGVKLLAGFDKFDEDDREVEMNVTVPAVDVSSVLAEIHAMPSTVDIFTARFRVGGQDIERKIEFPASGRISIGRTGDNGLQINDASISKIHATLALTPEGRLSVADTGSTNGTFINGERIAYGKANLLENDDVVKFGLIDVTLEHIQRAVITPPAVVGEEPEKMDTVEIDGFEFKSRTSPEVPEAAEDEFVDTAKVAETLGADRKSRESETEEEPDIAAEPRAEEPETAIRPNVGMPETVLELKPVVTPDPVAAEKPIPMPGAKE